MTSPVIRIFNFPRNFSIKKFIKIQPERDLVCAAGAGGRGLGVNRRVWPRPAGAAAGRGGPLPGLDLQISQPLGIFSLVHVLHAYPGSERRSSRELGVDGAVRDGRGSDRERRRSHRIDVGHARISTGPQKDAVDAVYISTLNNTHAELIIKAIECKKNILCEKPMEQRKVPLIQYQK